MSAPSTFCLCFVVDVAHFDESLRDPAAFTYYGEESSYPPSPLSRNKFAMFTFNSLEALAQKASDLNCDIGDEAFAIGMDKLDPLSALRDDFMVPKASEIPTTDCSKVEDGEADCIYLCGNSLGLMPKKAQEYVQEDMKKWGKMGVHGKAKQAVVLLPQAHASVSGIRSMPTRKNRIHGRCCQKTTQ